MNDQFQQQIDTQGNNDINEQENQDSVLQKKSKRYKKCPDCDEYYEIIDNQSNHSCIAALKARVSQQQDQISNMITKEEIAEILKGYIPHDAFLNFVRATEKKFSELFHNMNTHEEILKSHQKPSQSNMKCPTGHKLSLMTGARLSNISCDLCTKNAVTQGNHTQRCEDCNFDICATCEGYLQQVKCKNSHLLCVINPDDFVDMQCNSCLVIISTTKQFSYRCKQCDYDLCQKCFTNQTKSVNTKKSTFF